MLPRIVQHAEFQPGLACAPRAGHSKAKAAILANDPSMLWVWEMAASQNHPCGNQIISR